MVRIILELILGAIAVVGHPSFLEDIYAQASGKSHSPLINFVSKADELENGKYIFYNKNPSISFTGSIPRRNTQLNLADNLFLRLLPHCGCSRCKFYCGCCSQALLSALHIDTMVCVKVEYLEKDIGFSYSVVVNDEVYMKKMVTVKDPPPVCFGIPTPLPRLRSSACITMYDIEVDGDQRTVHGCIRVSGTLLNMFNSDYDLGCFDINVQNHFFDKHRNESHSERSELDIDQMLLLQRLKEYKVNETLLNANPFIQNKNDVINEVNGTGDYKETDPEKVVNSSITLPGNESASSNSSKESIIIDNIEYDNTLQQMRNLFPGVDEYDKPETTTEKQIDLDQLPFS